MRTRNMYLFSSAVPGLSASLTHADSFSIDYQFTGGSQNPNTISGDISGDSAAFTGYDNKFGFSSSSNTAYIRTTATPSSMDSGKYLSFTISPTVSGESLFMDTFSFSLGGGGTEQAAPFTAFAKVRAGHPDDDFDTLPDLLFTPGGVTTPSHSAPGGGENSFSSFTADLSDAYYQGLDEITFRIYLFDDVNSAYSFTRIDDMSATGTAAIPEPATSALLTAVGGLLVCVHLKRNGRR
ncbi:hypothetical protein [Puniceicoccus vermicola]|uniref:PEP-CTERM sorting domain-containing protein n=1 Tax=Puniceicoccus vermicola TaxID=388746 RepID=A0A7X1E377_9BACT|nr:hypothetical protein [Puniceicoccus vermicola]MBC2600801.1 hypothetical protein [Puniceicoccus vermicola]